MSPALPRTAARAVPVAVALALALGLSGCGSGLRAQTYQERAAADATNEAAGSIAIRNVTVLAPTNAATYPAGSDARVTMTLVNEGDKEDRVTSVTSDAASSVEVLGTSGGSGGQLVVPPQGVLPAAVVVLRGLTREIRPGEYVKMSLTFQDNGSIDLLVPVGVTNSPPPQSDYKPGETDSKGQPIVEPSDQASPAS